MSADAALAPMHEVVVYGPRISPFVEKVLRGAALKQLPFRHVERGSRRSRRGKVPVARIGAGLYEDSTFILRELERRQAEPPLWSRDPRVAAAQRNLEDWSDESLYFCVFAVRWSPANAPAVRAELARLRGRIPRSLFDRWLRWRLGRQPTAQGMGRLPYDVLLRETGVRLDDLTRLLADRPFFYGRRPSAADLALYGQLRTALSPATPDLGDLVRARSALVEWMGRVEACTGGA